MANMLSRLAMTRPVGALAVGALVLTLGALPLGAQEIRVREGTYAVAIGSSIALPIEIETTEPVTGFSFGVRHDAAKLRLDQVTLAEDLAAALGLAPGADPSGDFFLIDTELEDGPGFVVAAILATGEEEVALGAGTHRLFDAVYTALEGATEEAVVEVTGELGEPDAALIIDVSGTSRAFEPSQTSVRFSSGFVRGDVDQNGNIGLPDALRVLNFLFRSGQLGTCPPSLNVDGSISSGDPAVENQSDIQLNDAVLLLNYVFLRGVPPAAPFPDCGSSLSPLGADMICDGFICP